MNKKKYSKDDLVAWFIGGILTVIIIGALIFFSNAYFDYRVDLKEQALQKCYDNGYTYLYDYKKRNIDTSNSTFKHHFQDVLIVSCGYQTYLD